MSDARRIDAEPGFVLHTYPYSETSLIADAFTRRHGRVALLARGARRPRSSLRGLLIGFQPLALGWSGRGEVRTLMRAEWVGGMPLPNGEALVCGFYLNELIIRLLAREDPHERLYDEYSAALAALAADAPLAATLRRFEKELMRETGYALRLDRDVNTGAPIEHTAHYTYDPERGPIRLSSGQSGALVVGGQALIDLAADDFTNPSTLVEIKQLMRTLIHHRLDARPLLSRQMMRDLRDL